MIPTILPKEKRKGKRIGKITMSYTDQEVDMLSKGTYTLSKRQCVTLMMTQYDPSVLITLVTLPGKLLMQAVAGVK